MTNFKSTVALLCMLLLQMGAYAQKGSVNKASALLTKGELAMAKAEIDVAIGIEKNAAKSKTWLVRGKIYEAIALDTIGLSELDADALAKSLEAYNKIDAIDKGKGLNVVEAMQKVNGLWETYFNKAVAKYSEEDMLASLANFEKALMVRPEDSLTLYYTGSLGQTTEKIDIAKEKFHKMIELGYANKEIFSAVIFYERKDGNEDKALELSRKGKEQFPNEASFAQTEIAILIKTKKLEEAENQLLDNIKADSSDIGAYLNLGNLYDNIANAMVEEKNTAEADANFAKAKNCYIKALEIDSKDYVANYNIGASYINAAKVIIDEVQNMNMKDYSRRGAKLESKAKDLMSTARPYLETAMEQKPNDLNGLFALKQIYVILKMTDKAEQVIDKIDELQGTTEQ